MITRSPKVSGYGGDGFRDAVAAEHDPTGVTALVVLMLLRGVWVEARSMRSRSVSDVSTRCQWPRVGGLTEMSTRYWSGEHGWCADGDAGGEERDGDGAGGQGSAGAYLHAGVGGFFANPSIAFQADQCGGGHVQAFEAGQAQVGAVQPVAWYTVRWSCSNGCAISNRVRHAVRVSPSSQGWTSPMTSSSPAETTMSSRSRKASSSEMRKAARSCSPVEV